MSASVQDIMSAPVLTIDLSDSLWDAWQMLSVSGLRHLIVTNRDGQCLGVISDRNVLADSPLTREHLAAKQVQSIISTQAAFCLRPEDSPKHAALLMTEQDLDALAVCSPAGRVLGIVTQSDLLSFVS
jgi:CBS-domain-containing membrane protein